MRRKKGAFCGEFWVGFYGFLRWLGAMDKLRVMNYELRNMEKNLNHK